MTGQHVTMSLLMCLLLTGVSCASFRYMGMDFDNVEQFYIADSEQDTGVTRPGEYNLSTLAQAPVHDPPQCARIACPPAKVLADRGSYKKVFFYPAPYAKSRLTGTSMIPAFYTLYHRLKDYYTGKNSKKEKLPMAAPVILRNDPGDDMFSPKNHTLFFFMDPKVKSPPEPLDDRIVVLEVNAYTLYIRTFSSYPLTYADWMKELLQLAADVEADKEPYKKGFYYFASYDDPARLTHRINEVQLLMPHDKGL